MNLNDIKPGNTKRARATAVKAFERFIAAESTNMEHVRVLIAVDPDHTGCILMTLMDKFGVYLAFHTGTRGQSLSRHSAAQYVRQVKCRRLDEYPVQGGLWTGIFSVWDAHLSNTASSAKVVVLQEGSCVHEGESKEDDELSVFNG
ncbi:hypothetical protein PHMEG_00012885 [Phytophthora megakarya]|uniref:Uncharacterized protein n=1 Tax=Phytophthora megakarya TaxID=4795 RepID=A0A225W7L7_9STRA|nr:hypothetical protein PHMEG_00012885 [Phytophthora megakarya]